MEVGIVDYLLRADEQAVFQAALEAGCDVIDLSMDQPEDAGRLLSDDERLGRILERMRTTGVRIRAIYATCFLRLSLTTDEAITRARAYETLRDLASLAGNLGVGTLIVPLFGASEIGEPDLQPKLDRLLTTTLKAIGSLKIRVAFKSLLPAPDMTAAMERIGGELLGICADPANDVPLGRDPHRELQAAAGRIVHVHLKDRTVLGEPKELGGGELGIAGVIAQLANAGYNGPIVLETPGGDLPVNAARQNMEFLRGLQKA